MNDMNDRPARDSNPWSLACKASTLPTELLGLATTMKMMSEMTDESIYDNCEFVIEQMLMSCLWENQAGVSGWPDSDFDEIFTNRPSNRLIRLGKLRFAIQPNFPCFWAYAK